MIRFQYFLFVILLCTFIISFITSGNTDIKEGKYFHCRIAPDGNNLRYQVVHEVDDNYNEQMVAGYNRRYSRRTRNFSNRPSSSLGALRNSYPQPDRITFDEINSYVKDKHINGYLDVFRLFYRINKMEQYTNFVAFVLDKEGYEILKAEGYPVFHYKNNVLSQRDASHSTKMWTTAAFDKMVLKLCIIKDLLLLKYHVLYMDADVFLFKNPFPFLSQYSSYDFVAQKDDDICAGFMYLNPTSPTVHLIHLSLNIMYTREIMDQDAIQFMMNISKNSTKFAFLPNQYFMSGRDYAQTHQFIWDHSSQDKDIISYHNNYIIFMKNKLYRWKEQGLYLEDSSYYELSPYGYVYVDSINYPITRGLRQLAVLVNALNRTLIMPKFKCPPTVNLTYCNICSWDDCCEYGFQHTIHNNFKAHQILYDTRTPQRLLDEYKNNVVYEYECTNNKETVIQGNKILLRKKMTEKDLNPFSKDNNTLLIHIKNVPNCIKESKVDMRGYKLK